MIHITFHQVAGIFHKFREISTPMKPVLVLLALLLSLGQLCAQANGLPAVPKEKEVLIPVRGGSLAATLALPKRFKRGPVVLLIAGSGPTDRNGNNPLGGKNNSLQYLAHHLAAYGVACLRYDKRGIGASKFAGMREDSLRFDDYVADAAACIAFLRQDKHFTRVIVAGHSEGSLIGMMAARGRADAFVSIAGAGLPAGDLLKDQLQAQAFPDLATANAKIDSLAAGQAVHVVTATDAMLFRPSVQPYMMSWLRHDPRVEIARLDIPVLLIQGTRDIQIPESHGRALLAAQPRATLYLIEGMNHVFRIVDSDDRSANLATYRDIHLPLSFSLYNDIVDFVRGL